ncbi:MAG: PaaI family thioesterase [Hyphomonadaceae bacterium]
MSDEGPNPPTLVKDGPFAGWSTWGTGADPYETAIGPFYMKVEDARVRCAFQPLRHHLNGGGSVHGGALMTFADFALFAIAHNELREVHAVTLTCNSEFIGAGNLDSLIEATGEVLRDTRSVIFARGVVTQGSRTLLAFSGTLKKVKR